MKKIFKKLKIRSLLFFLSALAVSGLLIAGYLHFFSKPASASWFNENWLYRSPIAITNSSGSDQTDFQVSFTLDTATLITNGKMQSSCNDLRVTDIQGKLLPQWIEENNPGCNSATTKVWVKVPSIATSGQTLYVYYGNASAPSASSSETASKVFDFFDDFNNSSVNTNKWVTSGSPAISSNALSLTNAKVVSNVGIGSTTSTKTIGFRAKTTSTSVNTARFGYSDANNLSNTMYNADSAHVVMGDEQAYLASVASTNERALWKFDELAGNLINGNDAVDSSGNSNDITASANGATRATGIHGYGIYLDGYQYLRQKTYATQATFAVSSASSTQIVLTGDASAYSSGSTPYIYMVTTGGTGGGGWGYLGTCTYSNPSTTCNIYTTRTGSTNAWNTSTPTGTSFTYIIRKSAFNITGNALTLGAWIKPSAANDYAQIISRAGTGSTNKGYLIGEQPISTNKKGWAAVSIRGDDLDSVDGSTTAFATNGSAWYFYVFTYDGAKLRLYVNGVQDDTDATTLTGNIFDTNVPLDVGADGGGGSNWKGTIDSPFVLSQALTLAQIKALYNASGSNYTYDTGHTATQTITDSATAMDTNYHTFEITQAASTSLYSIDGGAATTVSTNSPTTSQYIRLENTDASNAVNVDYIYARKYVATAPSTEAAGAEEQGTGPVGYWKFDDPSASSGQVAKDSSSSGNDGTLGADSNSSTDDPTWQPEDGCVAGKCLYFDGTDDITTVPDNPTLDFGSTTDFTISAWVKPNAIDDQDGIIVKEDSWNNNKYALQLFVSGGQYKTGINLHDGTNSYQGLTPNGSIALNRWNHIEAVIDRDQSAVSIYINGVAQTISSTGTLSAVGDISSSAALLFGKYYSGSYMFKGQLDEPRIYPYARTAAQIKTDYDAGKANAEAHSGTSAALGSQPQDWLSNGLISYWKMDEASWDTTAGQVLDASGNGNNGTSAANATTAAGKFGNSGTFDGTGDYVNISDTNLPTGSNARTVSAWVKTSSGSLQEVFSYGSGSSGQALTIGTWGAQVFVSGWTSPQYQVTATNLNNGSWHLITFAYDGTNASTYMDGALLDKRAITINTVANAGKIGARRDGTTEYFNGQIDEMRVYNRALSPKEASDLYNWAPGPVGYWKMDDKVKGASKTIVDTSGNGNNGTTYGTGIDCSKIPGKYGGGCSFNGTDDYVSAANNSVLNFPNGEQTLEAWVNPNSVTGPHAITAKGDGSTSDDEYLFEIDPNNNAPGSLSVYYKEAWRVSTTTPVVTNKWQHVAAVITGGNTITFYYNGVKTGDSVTGITGTYGPTLTGTLMIGKQGTSSSNYFSGSMDDVKIYNYARTQKQIVSDMEGGGPAPRSLGAVGYWKFDEGQGTTANNRGNGGSVLNGTLTLMATAPSTATSGWTQAGKFNKGLIFDGSDDYVSIPYNNALDVTTAFTLSAWVKITSNTVYPSFISKGGDSTSGEPHVYFLRARPSTADQKFQMFFMDSNGVADANEHFLSSTSTWTADTWTHVVGTYDGDKMRIYINGKLDNTSASISQNVLTNTYVAEIGRRYGDNTNAFNGSLDEVKIYNYALTADEVKLDYNRGSSLVLGAAGTNSTYAGGAANQEYCVPGDATSCAAPVGRWDFEEGSGTSAFDTSGNGKTGTLSTPTYKSGKFGKALSFNGTSDNVTFTPTITGVKTVSFWVNPTSTSQYFLDLDGGTHYISASSGTVSATGFDTPTIYANGVSGGTITANTWNHIEVTTATGFDTTTSMTFGKSTTNYLSGKLDKVIMFNYARSAAQVAYDYNRGGPVGWWKFDECQGLTAYDSSGKGNNGTITIGTGAGTGQQDSVGTCTTNASTAWYNGRTGKRNASLNFDGIDDKVTIGTAITGVQSVAFWVKPATSTDSFMDLDGGTHYITASSGTVSATGFSTPTIYVNGVSGGTITGNAWNHIVVTTGTAFNSTTSFTLGYKAAATADYLAGQVDDVRVYNYALTGTQVKDVYNGGAVNFGPSTGSP